MQYDYNVHYKPLVTNIPERVILKKNDFNLVVPGTDDITYNLKKNY